MTDSPPGLNRTGCNHDRSRRAPSRRVRRHASANFQPGDAFVFGSESCGLPNEVLDEIDADYRLRLPLLPGNRSLNLSNAVAVMVYEAWRQQDFAGGV